MTGEVVIEHAGRRVAAAGVGGRQVRLALALLVLERARPVRRDELAELLWPDQPPRTWEAAQRGVLGRVRRALASAGWEPPDVLTTYDGTYRLRLPSDLVVDVEDLARGVDNAEAALALGNRVVALSHAAAVASLAERSLLEGDDSPWLDVRRAELRAGVVRALTTLARAALDSGDPAAAVEIATRLVQLEPFGEQGHRLVIEAYAASGDRILASRAFEVYREVLDREIGAKPSTEMMAAWRNAVSQRPDRRPPPSGLTEEVARLRSVGDEAMRRPDRALAAEHYAAAAAAAGRGVALEAKADLLIDAGQARKLAGDPAGAEQVLTEAADLARRLGNPVLLGRAALALAGMERTAPRVAPLPLQLIEEALDGLTTRPTPLRAALLARRAQYLADDGRLDELESTSRDAADVARSCGAGPALLDALIARLHVLAGAVRAGERVAVAGEIRERVTDPRSAATRLLALEHRVWGLVELGEWRAALSAMRDYKREAETSALAQARWFASQHRVCELVVAGALGDCDAAIDASATVGLEVVDERVATASAVMHRTVPWWLEGRLPDLGDDISHVADWLSHPPRSRAALALVAATSGDRREARRLIGTVLEDVELRRGTSSWVPAVCYAAAACLRAGTQSQAAELRALLLPFAGRDGTFQGLTYYGSYGFFTGALAVMCGNGDVACAELETALAHHGAMGARPWIVLTSQQLVRALTLRGAPRDQARARRLARDHVLLATEIGMERA